MLNKFFIAKKKKKKTAIKKKFYLKEVHVNGNLKVPRKFIKEKLGADSVMPN